MHRSTLDGSWDKRLRGGSVEPDRVRDLHGMNLDTAWRAIDRALERSIAAGDRVLLLITGHHRVGDPPVERGRIRAAVHDWLAHSRHASKIAAVRGAHQLQVQPGPRAEAPLTISSPVSFNASG